MLGSFFSLKKKETLSLSVLSSSQVFFFIGSNNYSSYIKTYTTGKTVNEVRIYASQSTYYYTRQNLQYATYRVKKDLN